jgi:hypothetical protein
MGNCLQSRVRKCGKMGSASSPRAGQCVLHVYGIMFFFLGGDPLTCALNNYGDHLKYFSYTRRLRGPSQVFPVGPGTVKADMSDSSAPMFQLTPLLG